MPSLPSKSAGAPASVPPARKLAAKNAAAPARAPKNAPIQPKTTAADRKKEELLNFWRSSNLHFFPSKELEKVCLEKFKIRGPQFKDIVECLVAEKDVCCDKIGCSSVYWLNPARTPELVQKRKMEEVVLMETELGKLKVRRAELKAAAGEVGGDDRAGGIWVTGRW